MCLLCMRGEAYWGVWEEGSQQIQVYTINLSFKTNKARLLREIFVERSVLSRSNVVLKFKNPPTENLEDCDNMRGAARLGWTIR